MLKNHKTKYRTLVLIFLTFVAPLIIAWIAHLTGTENLHTTQRGILIRPASAISLDSQIYNLKNNIINQEKLINKWNILYIAPKICDSNCNNIKNLLNNLHIALNKDKSRVNVITAGNVKFIDPINLPNDTGIFILDPKLLAVIYYYADANLSDLLKDLKILLKNSHV